MPAFPVYVFQRIDQGVVLDEFESGVDLNADGELTRSNTTFAGNRGSDRHSPLWRRVRVRTVSDYPSFDGGDPGIRSEADFLDEEGEVRGPWVVGLEETEQLLGCPLQAERGAL
jgi:hypothetical protein